MKIRTTTTGAKNPQQALQTARSTSRLAAVNEQLTVHLDLDGAWTATGKLAAPLALPTVEARAWGPRLRFAARRGEIGEFFTHIDPRLGRARFLAYGSGDFHHLSALWLRRAIARGGEPGRGWTLVSFDNHPDWDIRPPAWCCGSWVNRALELPALAHASLWGMGNFECWGWHRLTGNRRDVRRGRLAVQAWADGRSAADRARVGSILRGNWREKFTAFAASQRGRRVYVTIDLDGLRAEEAVTNWENGRFTREDVRWALGELRAQGAEVAAGDLCGAWSPQGYARWRQCFAANADHPRLPNPEPGEALAINLATLRALWPALTGGDEHDAGGDEQRAEQERQGELLL